MVNTDDFIERLERLLDYYTLSASAFADKIEFSSQPKKRPCPYSF